MITLGEIAKITGGRIAGDQETAITGIKSIADAGEGEITFLSSSAYIEYLKESRASAIIVSETTPPELLERKNALFVKNPLLAYAQIANFFLRPAVIEKGVNPLATVGSDTIISPDASVSAYAWIGSGVVLEKNVVIHPFVTVGDGSLVGESTILYPHVTIYPGVKIGKRVTIHAGSVVGSDGFGYVWDGSKHLKIPQLGVVEIENDVEIGANVTIDRASLGSTFIGAGTKIDNLVQIAHNVRIGKNSIIVAQVGIAGSSSLGNNVILAGQAGVRDHVSIGNNVKAAGQTGITKDIPDNSEVGGTPHMPYREWLRLQGYLKRLPKLFEAVKSVEKKLHLEKNHD